MSPDDIVYCTICHSQLREPFIKCDTCMSVFLCLSCFSKGSEKNEHSNDHPYEIIRYTFHVLDVGWTAADEVKLINGISEFGIGNWVDVSRQVQTKSPNECKVHYFNSYIDNQSEPSLGLPEISVQNVIQPSPITYKPGNDPPRPSLNGSSKGDLALTGYMPARGDFTVDFDNYAEMEICDVDFLPQDEDLDQELKLALLDIYQRRLKERYRRHFIIKKHGLINMFKQMSSWHRYERTLGRRKMQNLAPISQLFSSSMDYDKYIESLHLECVLMHKINLLKENRKVGITKKHHLKVHRKLLKCRMNYKYTRTLLDEILLHIKNDASNLKLNFDDPIRLSTPKRTSTPLDIVGLPYYNDLSQKEKQLCSTVRLVPEAYMKIKELLLNEYGRLGFLKLGQARAVVKIDLCSTVRLVPEAYMKIKELLLNEYGRLGFLKLGQARAVVKIDVNKTRKIYDHLIEEKLINYENVGH